MDILVSKMPHSTEQLLEILKQKFSNRYSCELFSIGNQKNIFISRSVFAAVRISSGGNKISIVGSTKPSLPALISSLTLGIEIFYTSQRKKMVQELAKFLKEQYN